jgi:hypothetical protein
VIDAWAEEAIDDQLRKRSLCLELERLDQLTEVFYRRAVNDGDVQSGLLVTKIIERRCVMLGLSTPQQAVLQIVDSTIPKETTTDKIERVLREFASQDRGKDDDPTISRNSVEGRATVFKRLVLPTPGGPRSAIFAPRSSHNLSSALMICIAASLLHLRQQQRRRFGLL